MSIEEQIAELIDKYEGLAARRLRQFNEENTKKDFILPLFRHLGWDVSNSDEVAAEEKSSNGRVDYAFKIGGVSKFYLEAKPLREDLNQRPDWAKQVITYAENKGVTWAVLTNFKQLMVFNAEWDKPALERARFLNLTYQEYIPAFHKLWWLSRDSVGKGMLDEEARQVGALKPKLPVEKSLLDQLLRWRGELFNQIYQHNRDRGLGLQQVDEPIQQFINRLIFIRSTEDRGIEENRLRAALHQWRDSGRKGELVERMRAIFHEFATLYDSDLFPPLDTRVLDTWDSLFVESDTIERIIEGSYERPTRLAGYDFAAIDADVLGAVYEQYLGYVAQEAKKRATEQARLLGFEAPAFELEARRIKRKQQGIYYTPEFVTNYIVKETVGRFIKEHSYNDIFNIKILDPACGSGSFLIRAYDELLHYHARQKGKSPAELDQWERLSILNRNIFGVDLDRQAVEITRLSLLLSCLAQREILPSLADNIRQGNSLISGTEEELKKYFGDNWQYKKRFNWEEEFKDIMANGGFDVVIGNPPYLFGEYINPLEKEYIKAKYLVAKGQYDAFWLFYERCLYLVKEDGYHGFIVPDAILVRDESEILRKLLLQNTRIKKIAHVGQVFQDSGVSAVIIIFQKSGGSPEGNIIDIEKVDESGAVLINRIKQCDFLQHEKHAFVIDLTPTWDIIRQKLSTNSLQLRTLVSLSRGEEFGKKNLLQWRGAAPKEKTEILVGEDVTKYSIAEPSHLIDKVSIGKPKDNYKSPKIVIVKTGKSLVCALDTKSRYTLQSLYNLQPKKDCRFHLSYILGVLNSTLMSVYMQREVTSYKRLFPQINQSHILTLPIHFIDFDNPAGKKMHDDLVALVDKILELDKRLAPIRNTSSTERDELLSEIGRTDAEIDRKVYELYGLTEEERQVIEASVVSESSSRSRQAKG